VAASRNARVVGRLVALESFSNEAGPALANLDAFQSTAEPLLADLEKFKKEAIPRLARLEAVKAEDRLKGLETFQKDAQGRLVNLEANQASIKGDLSTLDKFQEKIIPIITSHRDKLASLSKLDDKVGEVDGEVQKLKSEVGKLNKKVGKLEAKYGGPIHTNHGNGMLATQPAGAPISRYIESSHHDNGDASNINVRNYGQLSMHGNLVGHANIQGYAYNWGAVNSPQYQAQHILHTSPVQVQGPAILLVYLPVSSGSSRRSRSRSPRRLRYASSDASDHAAYSYNTMPEISIELSRRKGRGLFSKPEYQPARIFVGGGGGGGGSEGSSRGRRTVSF
jgi:hypothetical protein